MRSIALMAVASLALSLVVLTADEVRRTPRPASAATPYETAVLAKDPAAYWRFDDPPGTRTAHDSVGEADLHYDTYTSGVPAWRPGAILGDPSESKPMPYGGRLTHTFANPADYWSNSYTIEMWRYLDPDASDGGWLFAFHGVLTVGVAAGKLNATARDGHEPSHDLTLTGPTLTRAEWHHIVFTVDGSVLTLYLDGARVAGGTMDAAIVNGGPGGAGLVLDSSYLIQTLYGAIDELALYRRALRPGEIRANYAASGRTPPLVPPADINVPGLNELCPECNPGERRLRPMKGADPVDLASGTLTESVTDLAVPGRGMPVAVNRTYNSLRADERGLFGLGWSSPLDMVLRETADYAEITQENGAALPFTRLPNGTYQAPARVTSTLATLPGGGWRLVRNRTDIVTFDAQGRVASFSDRHGYVTTVTRAASSITVTAPGGRSIVWAIGADGLVTSVTDSAAASRKATYSYTAGRLTSVTTMKVNASDPAPVTWGYSYDPTGLLSSITDPRGSANLTVYDGTGRVDYQLDYAGQRTDIDYGISGANTWTRLTEPAHAATGTRATTEYVFTNNVVTSMTTGWGTVAARTSTYDYFVPSYFLKKVTGPGGAVQASYTYDAWGNVLTSVDAAGRTTTYAGYDAFNNPGTITDSAGNTATLTYNVRGDIAQSSVPVRPVGGALQGAAITTYYYDDVTHPEDVTRIRFPDQHGAPTPKVAEFSYRAGDGQLAWSEDPENNRTSYTYDGRGFVASVISPRGNATATAGDFTSTYVVNDFGMVSSATDPLDEVTSQTYDGNGNVISSTDANGQITTTEYDDMNRPLVVHRADGSEIETTYFPDGAVRAQLNGLGAPTTYTYDVHGAVLSSTDPNGAVTGYRYDGLGRLQYRIDPGGICPATACTAYGYDAGNQLTSVAYTDPGTPDITGVTYDALGQRTGVTRSVGAPQTWTWDNLGRLRSSTDPNGRTTGYGWTVGGSLATITYPGQSTPVSYTYDAAGRMTSLSDWAGRSTAFAFDPDSNWTTTTFPSVTTNVDTRTYDEAGRLDSVTWKRGTTVLGSLSYPRDPEGLIESETTTSTGFSTRTWGYDAVDQLDQVGVTVLDIDDAGNLVRTEDGTYQVFDPAQQLCWTSPTASGPCGSPAPDATVFDYDARGNRTAAARADGTTATYSYDQESRMVGVADGAERPVQVQEGSPEVGDFDGDAVDDILWATGNTDPDVVSWGAEPRGAIGRDSTSHDWDFPHTTTIGDYDGDGHDDIFRYQMGTIADEAWFYFGRGDGDYTVRSFTVNGTYLPVAGDFDGDGFDDIYWYGAGAGADHIWWGNTNVDTSAAFTSQAVNQVGDYQPVAGDLDGNGFDDIVWYTPGSGADQVYFGAGGRNVWAARTISVNGTYDLDTGDVDGDGKDDLFFTPAGAGGYVWWGNNANDYATTPQKRLAIPAGSQLAVGDFDGDDLADAYVDTGATDTVWWGTTRAAFSTDPAQVGGLPVDPIAASYTYDASGLRTAKTVGGATTQFSWNTAGGLPLLLSQHVGAATTRIVYGPGGTPLYQEGPGGLAYYHQDHQGSTRLVTGSTGTVEGRTTYDAYGAVDSTTVPAGLRPLLGYTGQYTDPETGFIYLRARYHDATTGQFTSVDPLAGTSREPYGYSGANPVMNTDPSGLFRIPGTNLCVDINDPNCESIVEQNPEESQAVVDFASGVLDVNPITATTNATGLSDTGQYADGTSGWRWGGRAAMTVFDLALPVGAASRSGQVGDALFKSRIFGANSCLFGNSSLGGVARSGLLNPPGRGSWRVGWSVNSRRAGPTVPGFRIKVPGIGPRYLVHATGFWTFPW